MIKARTKKVSVMSSEEEATAANVLSQMSQIQQISCETIEATVINVGHHCDVETTATQGFWNFFVLCRVILPHSLTHSFTCPCCGILYLSQKFYFFLFGCRKFINFQLCSANEGVVSGKCKTLREDDTRVFPYERCNKRTSN